MPHIVMITAGGAGMFCGSCMHDNTLAKSLQEIGTEVTLIPTYTPIRVDEPDQSINRVFLGGINVYLDSQFSWWNRLPGFLRKPLDAPWVINLATRFGVSNDAKRLGELTLAMLAGINGPQKNEIAELVDFIAGDLKPDAVLFSNALLSGVAPHLRKSFDGRICCLLQGDDIFLQDLTEPYQSKAKIAMRENAFAFDSLLSHSKFYRDFMSAELGIESERFEVVPLGIELEGHNGKPVDRNNDRFTIGYLARICPEKGLLSLVDAFETLHIDHPQTKLRVAGYCGPRDKDYLESVRQRAEPLGDAFEYIGSPDTRGEKVRFLQSLDVLSVPSPYREPKGLYVLEALANGVPVVQPDHGAFPELIATTGGGLLFEPKNSNSLTHRLRQLLQDADQRVELARNGHAAVREHLSGPKMAEITRNALLAGRQPFQRVSRPIRRNSRKWRVFGQRKTSQGGIMSLSSPFRFSESRLLLAGFLQLCKVHDQAAGHAAGDNRSGCSYSNEKDGTEASPVLSHLRDG